MNTGILQPQNWFKVYHTKTYGKCFKKNPQGNIATVCKTTIEFSNIEDSELLKSTINPGPKGGLGDVFEKCIENEF